MACLLNVSPAGVSVEAVISDDQLSIIILISGIWKVMRARMTEGENCHKEARSARPAKKEILILPIYF
jgi:hypothetical protein